VTEAGYHAINKDFKKKHPQWNCHYCGFANAGMLTKCRICNGTSLHAQLAQTGTVDISADADLHELAKQKPLTDEQKSLRSERNGGTRSTTRNLFHGQEYSKVQRVDALDDVHVNPDLLNQTMELSPEEEANLRTFVACLCDTLPRFCCCTCRR